MEQTGGLKTPAQKEFDLVRDVFLAVGVIMRRIVKEFQTVAELELRGGAKEAGCDGPLEPGFKRQVELSGLGNLRDGERHVKNKFEGVADDVGYLRLDGGGKVNIPGGVFTDRYGVYIKHTKITPAKLDGRLRGQFGADLIPNDQTGDVGEQIKIVQTFEF